MNIRRYLLPTAERHQYTLFSRTPTLIYSSFWFVCWTKTADLVLWLVTLPVKSNSQQRGNWDHFGSDWASFKYQLCWFCYADLATLTPCYIHLLSRKKAQKYIIPADVEWGGNGGRCLETCLETTRSDLCINYSYYYCTPVFTTSHIFCFQHSWTSLEVPPTLTSSSAQQKCT